MDYIDIPAIEQYARQLRAQEIRRMDGVFVQQLRIYAELFRDCLQSLFVRLNRAAHAFMAETPPRGHSY